MRKVQRRGLTRRQALGLDPLPEGYKAKGLGDTIERLTTATGIKSVVDKVSQATGKDCGCSDKRDTLNRVFPYKK
tara:strand:+ start:489 stop:713 length:225 start_codon:yes stop_codon:yes gene_type:complete